MNILPSIRGATKEDSRELAELINFAGDGMPLYLWEQMTEPGEDAWEVGQRRAQREEGSFSYRNASVTESRGRVAGCLIGYPLADQPEPVDYDEMPPMFVPLQELEDLAAGTWYVNVVAAYPAFRGQGVGTQLMGAAERYAAETRRQGLSLIVADANTGARRLYERLGYREVGQRPMVKEQWPGDGQNWVLLIKDLA